VRGCDVWVNLPRPPLEASGTSGMKAAMNGGLNLSVLDGWFAEAFDGGNGWGFGGGVSDDWAAQDAEDAAALYGTLEEQVLPMFYERDAAGLPRRWLAMVKRSLATLGPRFAARRMVGEYGERWG
jgi:starch phosphorylase